MQSIFNFGSAKQQCFCLHAFASDLGAIWGGLQPTVIVIAIYFCFADFILLGQVIYYDRMAQREKDENSWATNDPTRPLLAGGARRRSSAIERRRSHAMRRDSLSAILVEEPSSSGAFARNSLSILGVVVAGTVGWGFAWWAGAWDSHGGGSGV